MKARYIASLEAFIQRATDIQAMYAEELRNFQQCNRDLGQTLQDLQGLGSSFPTPPFNIDPLGGGQR